MDPCVGAVEMAPPSRFATARGGKLLSWSHAHEKSSFLPGHFVGSLAQGEKRETREEERERKVLNFVGGAIFECSEVMCHDLPLIFLISLLATLETICSFEYGFVLWLPAGLIKSS